MDLFISSITECKYVVKEKKMSKFKFITQEIKNSSDDSDVENSNI